MRQSPARSTSSCSERRERVALARTREEHVGHPGRSSFSPVRGRLRRKDAARMWACAASASRRADFPSGCARSGLQPARWRSRCAKARPAGWSSACRPLSTPASSTRSPRRKAPATRPSAARRDTSLAVDELNAAASEPPCARAFTDTPSARDGPPGSGAPTRGRARGSRLR